MDAPEGTRRQLGGNDAITTRIGAVALPFAVLVLVVAEYFHPAKQDPMDNHAVFVEYAHSSIWTADHLAEYFGFLLLLGGLVALYHSVSAKRSVGARLPPFGLPAPDGLVPIFAGHAGRPRFGRPFVPSPSLGWLRRHASLSSSERASRSVLASSLMRFSRRRSSSTAVGSPPVTSGASRRRFFSRRSISVRTSSGFTLRPWLRRAQLPGLPGGRSS
jgi:hypothetical protein